MSNKSNKLAKNRYLVNKYLTIDLLEARLSHPAILQLCRFRFRQEQKPYQKTNKNLPKNCGTR
jgi:hypothetical protein